MLKVTKSDKDNKNNNNFPTFNKNNSNLLLNQYDQQNYFNFGTNTNINLTNKFRAIINSNII